MLDRATRHSHDELVELEKRLLRERLDALETVRALDAELTEVRAALYSIALVKP